MEKQEWEKLLLDAGSFVELDGKSVFCIYFSNLKKIVEAAIKISALEERSRIIETLSKDTGFSSMYIKTRAAPVSGDFPISITI